MIMQLVQHQNDCNQHANTPSSNSLYPSRIPGLGQGVMELALEANKWGYPCIHFMQCIHLMQHEKDQAVATTQDHASYCP